MKTTKVVLCTLALGMFAGNLFAASPASKYKKEYCIGPAKTSKEYCDVLVNTRILVDDLYAVSHDFEVIGLPEEASEYSDKAKVILGYLNAAKANSGVLPDDVSPKVNEHNPVKEF